MSTGWKILVGLLFALVIAQCAALFHLWPKAESPASRPEAVARAPAPPPPATPPPRAATPQATREGEAPASPNPQATREGEAPASPNPQAIPRATPPRPAAFPPPAAQAQPAPPARAFPSLTDPPPAAAPWQGLPDATAALNNPRAVRAGRIRQLQEKMRALTANGRQPSPMEMDPILRELAEIQGSNTVGGVDLQVLRDNLKVADRMQKLAQDLAVEARKPAAEQDAEKIRSLQAAILQEQRGLRLDFMAGGAAQPPKQ